MTTNRPHIVYKYHKINDHLFDLLRNGQLWFSHQSELNDPYDCKYSFSDSFLNSWLDKSSKALLKDLQDRVPSLKNVNSDILLEKISSIHKSDKRMNEFYQMLFGEILGWSVCCFTTNPLNELMWAHYADSNKGVCLEFDFTKTPDLYDKLFPVKYNDTFPEINSIDELSKALFLKRTAWIKEDEWRIIANVKGAKPFNKESLIAVCFGCNVDRTTIENIRLAMIESGYKKVDFKQLNFQIKGVTLKPINKQE